MLPAVVLCGGASRRMGRDKALIGNPPWAHRVAAALEAGGCGPAVLAGGDPGLARGPWPHRGDATPGAGPGAAVLDECRRVAGSGLVVAACDLPMLDAHHVRVLLEHLAAGERAAAYRIRGRAQWSLVALSATLVSALALRPVLPGVSLGALFDADAVLHDPDDPDVLSDLDTPGDLSDTVWDRSGR